MASLTTLPAELLTQILTDQTLTTFDISNCALTSRRLYNLTADRKTKYSFHIDHRSQSTWKLIACILSNPRIGHRIHRIIVTWHRRNPHKPKSWTPQWLWKSQELEQIKSICGKYGVEFLYPVIEDGFNSEALLPFLLCLTPNLQSLDFGAIAPSMIHGGTYSAEAAVRIFKACERRYTGQNYKVRHNIKDRRVYFDSRWGSSYRQNILWTYSALNLPRPNSIPGLSNLKHFRHGPSGPWRRRCPGWPAEYMIKILLLPNLKTASFCGAVTFNPTKPGDDYKPLSATLEFTAGKKSSVKELEIINCELERSDYSTLAELTGSLEVFKGTVFEGYHWWRSGNKLSYMINTFRENNPKTLAANNISVKRSNSWDLAFTPAPDIYFPFRAQDQREDTEDMDQRFKEEQEGREYSESLIWKDEEDEDEDEDEDQGEDDNEYVCDHESECGCDWYFYSTEYEEEDDDPYWTDFEGDDDVVLRTRDVKGSKKRSHFVKVA
ncbi:hypothetical protein TWF106_000612 [Orbilia oligospora]|uniref:F-box domain-containing protein n=1 Tax=Orbilia oligospora TaxID=2813651 RepID=A0A6G1M2R1_ORBOL|nr:hypothetical protein TWF679_000587 [Orbilia oligospora]KAF3206736.1 hypothetical protein TWF106_000612 [Orbilia oligospora]KAF3243388.1 hypothetical protein TWF192_008295 [Orbilia oligospora]